MGNCSVTVVKVFAPVLFCSVLLISDIFFNKFTLRTAIFSLFDFSQYMYSIRATFHQNFEYNFTHIYLTFRPQNT